MNQDKSKSQKNVKNPQIKEAVGILKFFNHRVKQELKNSSSPSK